MNIADIHWLAGILDRVGSWGVARNGKRKFIHLSFELRDKSLVDEIARILDKARSPRRRDQRGWTDNSTWQIRINGRRAHGWLMTLAAAMRTNRRDQLIEFLRGT